MRFLDSNVFIYAFYKPGRQLGASERAMKESAKKIVSDLSEGRDRAVTTVVHLSEVANVLKHGLAPNRLAELITGLLMLDSVDVLAVSRNDYLAATDLGRELDMDPNDALAVQVMQSMGLREVYSFDKAFVRVDGIKRLPALG